VKAVGGSTAYITAAAVDGSNVKAICEIKVKQEYVSSIRLRSSHLTLVKNYMCNLNATVAPATATNKQLKYVSSNESIASVDANGMVTGINPVSAIITITSVDDSDIRTTCKVTVTAPVSSDSTAPGKTETVTPPVADKTQETTIKKPTAAKPSSKAPTVTIKSSKSSVTAGQKIKLTAASSKNTKLKKITWKSSNSKIATIDQNGNVKAKKA